MYILSDDLGRGSYM